MLQQGPTGCRSQMRLMRMMSYRTQGVVVPMELRPLMLRALFAECKHVKLVLKTSVFSRIMNYGSVNRVMGVNIY